MTDSRKPQQIKLRIAFAQQSVFLAAQYLLVSGYRFVGRARDARNFQERRTPVSVVDAVYEGHLFVTDKRVENLHPLADFLWIDSAIRNQRVVGQIGSKVIWNAVVMQMFPYIRVKPSQYSGRWFYQIDIHKRSNISQFVTFKASLSVIANGSPPASQPLHCPAAGPAARKKLGHPDCCKSRSCGPRQSAP